MDSMHPFGSNGNGGKPKRKSPNRIDGKLRTQISMAYKEILTFDAINRCWSFKLGTSDEGLRDALFPGTSIIPFRRIRWEDFGKTYKELHRKKKGEGKAAREAAQAAKAAAKANGHAKPHFRANGHVTPEEVRQGELVRRMELFMTHMVEFADLQQRKNAKTTEEMAKTASAIAAARAEVAEARAEVAEAQKRLKDLETGLGVS